MTVPTLGFAHTVVVDGSRLCWASPSPVHEGLGYRPPSRTGYKVMRCCRIRHRPSPGSRFAAHAAPIVPTRKLRAVLASVKAWPDQTGACGPCTATASLDGACARRIAQYCGRDEETAQSNQETNRRSNLLLREFAAMPNPTS